MVLVTTTFTKTSGQGNPVFSRPGALNRFQHHAFMERNFQSQRRKADSNVPEEFKGPNEYLPEVLENEEERTLAEKKALTAMMLERTRMLNQTAMDKSRTEQDFETLLEHSIEKHPGRRTELTRPNMKRRVKKVSTAAFKSVTRNECFV